VGNRAYLLSLPFEPLVFGERPPSGAVAFAQYSLPFFWASLFDASSIMRPMSGPIFGLAAPRVEALARSERCLRACTEHFGWRSWPVAERWLEFLVSLEQPWIAVDVHDIQHGLPELRDVFRRLVTPPDDLSFIDYFGRFVRARPADNAVILAGVDHEDHAPPRPLVRLHSVAHSSAPPSGPQPVWRYAVEGLLGERDQDAWIRWFPTARASSLRSDVAAIGPGAFIWFDRDARAWTVLFASCEQAVKKVLGAEMPFEADAFAANESLPPLGADVAQATQLFDPSLVTMTYFEPYALLLRSPREARSPMLRRQA
jgi:hypothetical protein